MLQGDSGPLPVVYNPQACGDHTNGLEDVCTDDIARLLFGSFGATLDSRGVLFDSAILEDVLNTGTLSWLPTRGPSLGALKQLSEEEMFTAR